ncbi:MAG TPA: thioesterase family protein [Stellaceae bacterium]|nr:thioesterase family protein [Stellaceae bacterium]
MTEPLTARSAYRFWTSDILRFGDTDGQGHINNAVYATFCESGRVSLFHNEGRGLLAPGTNFVIARIELDYRAELHYPGRVDIGTSVLGLGRTSFRLGHAVFKGELCAATALSVGVVIDDRTRKSTPLPEKLRTWLETNIPLPLAR